MTDQQYQEAVEWLFAQAPNYQLDGKKAYKPGLQNITALCDYFGNPQNTFTSIHIGGTNGKGSTSNMVASVLQEAGYNIGLYNSPHLIDFTERIKVNGENSDRLFVYDFISRLHALPGDIQPSFFEFTTIMAFEYFRQKKVDFAVIEVGLGGRLDSTNIILPEICAITNVDFDHTEILGDTLEKIAREKSGIIKPGIPVVCGDEKPVVHKVLLEKADREQASFIDATKLEVSYPSDLKGNYQPKNSKVAVAIIQELRRKGFAISDEALAEGLLNVHRNTGFIGRWFQFSLEPLIICDTAHNLAGLKPVFQQLEELRMKKHIVLGFVTDKKIDEVMKILPPNADYYFVKPEGNRGRDPKSYEDLLKKGKINYQIFSNVQDGYLSARQSIRKDEMIFIGGSNFVVGDFLKKNLEK